MSSRLPVIDADGEVGDLSQVRPSVFRPAAQVLPPQLHADLLDMNRRAGVRGRQKEPTKVATTIRLSPEVMQAFKATGAGWQTRIDSALKEWLKSHTPG